MTIAAHGPCLDDLTIATLISDVISKEARERATTHLDTCSACRELVAGAALARPTVKEKPSARGQRAANTAPPASPAARDDRRYLDHAEIARGGMGRVVEATDTVLGRRVAVKEALTTDPEVLRRFAREIRITARLEHPSIVPIYDTGFSADGSPFYVMRKVSGRPLEDLVGLADMVDQRLALLPHVLAAANAVAHAHQRGIVHRDLKPSNILVGDLGETVVIDWGLAKVLDDPEDAAAPTAPPDPGTSLRTQIGTVFGTPGFMSPEQLAGEPVDERGDVYALGATLYYVLARQSPHASISGTAIMDAAAKGPPQPVRELVVGVPPALAAIVDKALAYDHSIRYRDAGALVEDLQRFLTGQLVACHHYTRRERIVRFVRLHRIAVAAIAAAAVVTATVIGVSLRRVLAERDRTDAALGVALEERDAAAAARERATTRADELTLAQAQFLIDTNPTAAIAMITPLASSPLHWRRVRSIAGAARSAGAAWGLPAPMNVTALEIGPDGVTALTCGVDGVLRVYDLINRTSRTLSTPRKNTKATFAGPNRIVSYGEHELRVIDLATGATHAVAPPSEIADVVATASEVIWGDVAGELWRTGIDLGPPGRIPFAGTLLSLSPDQRYVALQGTDRVALLVLATGRLVPIGEGRSGSVAWDPDGRSVAISIGGRIHDVSLDRGPTVTATFEHTMRIGLARTGDRIFYIQPQPFGIAEHTGGVTRLRELGGGGMSLLIARRDVLIALGASGDVVMISDERSIHLHPPVSEINHLATSPHGHYVVAAGSGRLLLWDLDLLVPRRIEVPAMSGFVPLGGGVITRSLSGPWWWVDLATGRHTSLGGFSPFASITSGPDPDRVLIGDEDRLWIFHRGDSVGVPVEGPVAFPLMGPSGQILVARPNGDIVLSDLLGHTSAAIGSHPSTPRHIEWSGTWISAQFADGFVWRHDLRTGTSSTLALGGAADSGFLVQLMTDGRMVVAEGARLVWWYPDGRLVPHARLPATVDSIRALGDDLALVGTEDHSNYAVELGRSDQIRSVLAAGSRSINSISSTTRQGLASDAGHFEVVDLTDGMSWPIETHEFPASAQFAEDGSFIVQMLAQDQLGAWVFALPATREQILSWIEGITNATSEHGPGSVSWPE